MGNTEPNLTTFSALEHFSKRFIISPHPLDSQQSIMFYLHQKLSRNKYILRILSTNDNEDKQRIQDLICKKLAMNKNNRNTAISVIPIDHYLFENQKGYCNSVNKCYLLFDIKNSQPFSHYLARGHYNRNLDKTINQETVYRGLLNLIEGVSLLKYYNQPHQFINCDTVYYDSAEGTFILADPWISPLNDTHEQYHAPEKLRQMKNQAQRHDPYLADLFSIGIVGLKALGHECFSNNRLLNQQHLAKLTQNIRHHHLRSLILRLVDGNPEVREEILHQIKFHTSASNIDLTDSSHSTKTRHLSGKVASLRKSFVNNDSRAISRINRPAPPEINLFQISQYHGPQPIAYHPSSSQPLQRSQPYNNFNFKKKEVGNNQAYQLFQNPTIYKDKQKPQHSSNVVSLPPSSASFIAKYSKPEIDIGLINAYPKNPVNEPLNKLITTPNNISYYPSTTKQPNYATFTNSVMTPTYYSSNYQPFFPSFAHNNFHSSSSPSLFTSNSDKLLKNVCSTPLSLNNEYGSKSPGLLFTSFSQNGFLFSGEQKQIRNQQVYPRKIQTLPTHQSENAKDIIFTKPQQVVADAKMNKININSPNDTNNTKFVSPFIQKQKAPLKTSLSYRSSQSFESDHFYQNKIYENIKQLENKVSEVINSSRLNVTDPNYSGLNLQNSQGRLIESVIIPKEQQNSSHTNTINILANQSRNIEDHLQIKQAKSVIKQIKEQKQPFILSPKQKQQNKQIIRQENQRDQSPILVRESDNGFINSNFNNDEQGTRSLDESENKSKQESIDYLNINSKQDEERNPSNQLKKYEQEEKYQDFLNTPAKTNNLVRLEGNNLTIPEESDEQSMDGQVSKNKGDYVEEVYQNGGKYVGYMLNGQRNGNGIFYYKDGGYYDGRWKNNMMNGYGKLYYQTGKLAYEGQWYQDQFHGRGTVYNDQYEQVPEEGFDFRNMNQSQNCWKFYQGDLSHDMKARYGKLMLPNDQYYEGEFKNDQVHGKGSFHRQDGTIIRGIWSQGILIREL